MSDAFSSDGIQLAVDSEPKVGVILLVMFFKEYYCLCPMGLPANIHY